MRGIQKIILTFSIIVLTIWSGSLFPLYTPLLVEEDIQTHAELVLEEMSIEQKVGQLFIFGFWGLSPTEHIVEMIEEKGLGGVILLGYNIGDDILLKELTETLQSLSKYPLFISIDQEGGVVARVKSDDTYNISQYELGSNTEAFNIAKKRGENLSKLGINLNYSPVLDNITESNSFLFNRSFRKTQEESSQLAVNMIKGYHSGGILSCIKHFPGHDNLTSDSHRELDSIDISKEQLDEYIYQFKEPLKYADAVMIGHLLFPLIDKENPVSISEYFLTTFLRQELGFKGLIITDDMQMNSIDSMYTSKESAIRAIKAGNDILIYIGKADEQAEVLNAVIEAVNSGEISLEELDSKVLRILRYKYSLE